MTRHGENLSRRFLVNIADKLVGNRQYRAGIDILRQLTERSERYLPPSGDRRLAARAGRSTWYIEQTSTN
jgi:hypothetical protein